MSIKRTKRERQEIRESYRRASDDMRCRSIQLKADSWDEETRSVRAVFATDAPTVSTDAKTGQGVLEIWRMDGCEYDSRAPLCDTHNRTSVNSVLGSVLPEAVEDGPDGGKQLVGRIQISQAEEKIATKVREGHIASVSGGVQALESENVPRGQTRSIRGMSHTAPKDRDLNVVTRWRLREVSLVPIGADPSAKIRSEGTKTMTTATRKFLERIGLRADASEADAKSFYETLPVVTRERADSADEGDDEAERKKREEAEEKDKKARADEEAKRKQRESEEDAERKKSAPVDDRVRSQIVEGERARVKELERIGTGLPAEVVRKAIDENWTVERAAPVFLDSLRDRTASAGPGIHSRSREADCTASALGFGLALRSCDGERLLKLGATYEPSNGKGGYNVDYRVRRVADRERYAKALEQVLDQADRYRGMSLHDICREACRLDGNPVQLHMGVEETFRTAVSGSALSNIFTTNINAEFLTGYMDYSDSTIGWVSESEKNNFLTNEVDTMGKFGRLKKAAKGRPAEHLDTSDWKESYKLARYTGQFVVDEQDIINDRFGAIESESPRDMGLTAAQLRPNLVYGVILENGALDVDGVALFHATHANYAADASGSNAGGPLAAGSMQAAIVAMAKQRINGRALNIRPRFLVVPQDQKFTAGILLKSAERIISTSDGGTYNPLKELEINLVVDDRIGVGGVVDPRTDAARVGTAVNWFLAARPGEEGAKTIEVGYRRGTGRAPAIRSFVLDKGQWGIGWDVSMDIGAKALDFRAMYMSKGSA